MLGRFSRAAIARTRVIWGLLEERPTDVLRPHLATAIRRYVHSQNKREEE